MSEEAADQVSELLDRINAAWTEGRPHDIEPLLDEEIVMVLPGFGGRVAGKEAVIGGFVDFCDNATLHGFEESDRQIDVVGDTAAVSLAFDIVYERDGERWHSTGRDLWIFKRQDGDWLAVWRTLIDVVDEPAA